MLVRVRNPCLSQELGIEKMHLKACMGYGFAGNGCGRILRRTLVTDGHSEINGK